MVRTRRGSNSDLIIPDFTSRVTPPRPPTSTIPFPTTPTPSSNSPQTFLSLSSLSIMSNNPVDPPSNSTQKQKAGDPVDPPGPKLDNIPQFSEKMLLLMFERFMSGGTSSSSPLQDRI
ncbi:hypothetical protein Pst134EB_023645 [Puccinia striiformis f. sp. tritici]|nr:hypothetical protein Pst134EB_023645 [Puccinia striiformis f. sp. tritici]